jgi:hypothetical protein
MLVPMTQLGFPYFFSPRTANVSGSLYLYSHRLCVTWSFIPSLTSFVLVPLPPSSSPPSSRLLVPFLVLFPLYCHVSLLVGIGVVRHRNSFRDWLYSPLILDFTSSVFEEIPFHRPPLFHWSSSDTSLSHSRVTVPFSLHYDKEQPITPIHLRLLRNVYVQRTHVTYVFHTSRSTSDRSLSYVSVDCFLPKLVSTVGWMKLLPLFRVLYHSCH